MHGNRKSHGFDRTGKFKEKAISGGIGNTAVIFGRHWFDQFGTVTALDSKGPLFVSPYKAGKSSNIRGHDRHQSALRPLVHTREFSEKSGGNPFTTYAALKGENWRFRLVRPQRGMFPGDSGDGKFSKCKVGKAIRSVVVSPVTPITPTLQA
ncbi:MAG: hypothetical protein VCF08_06575 [Alphaproteobacteria bacterium]